jgi:hypothetical protein
VWPFCRNIITAALLDREVPPVGTDATLLGKVLPMIHLSCMAVLYQRLLCTYNGLIWEHFATLNLNAHM